MARVTVEDCLKNVKNRFELVSIAAKRARQLMRGKEALVEWDNDKATVVALREIAAGHTNFDTPVEEEHDTPAQVFIQAEEVIVAIAPVVEPVEPEQPEQPAQSANEQE